MPNQIVFLKGDSTSVPGLRVGEDIYSLDTAARLLGFNSAGLDSAASLMAGWDHISEVVTAVLRDFPARRGEIERIGSAAELELLPPVIPGSAIYAVGANYYDHVTEMALAMGTAVPPDPKTSGATPWFFQKPTRCCAVAHGVEVVRPTDCRQLDWEAELAVLIGRGGRNIAIEQALKHIAGYVAANDLSARDLFVRQNLPAGSPFRYDWVAHKSFPGSCPLGPGFVPAGGLDPQQLSVRLWVNEELVQDSSTSQMIFNIAEQISHLSTYVELFPGDILLTGTPAGVGMARGRFLEPGDRVRVTIGEVGTLENVIAA